MLIKTSMCVSKSLVTTTLNVDVNNISQTHV